MRIKSVEGRLARDPSTRRIVGEDGLTIDPTNLYWARLLADGDVVETDEPASAAAFGESPAPVTEEPANG